MVEMYLCHHGIKGQKWGLQNGPPYPLDYKSHSSEEKKENPKSVIDGTENNPKGEIVEREVSSSEDTKQSKESQNTSGKLSEEEKKNLKKKILVGAGITAGALLLIGSAIYIEKTGSYDNSININSLNLGSYKLSDVTITDDLVISNDSTLYRTSGHDELRDGPVYLSTNKKDRDRYIHTISKLKSGDVFQMTIKSKEDLKIPSEKKQMEMFVDLLANDSSFSNAVTRNPYNLFARNETFNNREKAKEFAENYHYDNFITRMIDWNPTKNDELTTFVNYVKSKGYDGLIDVNDIRTISDSPVIVFDKNTLVIDSSEKLTAAKKFISGLKLENVKI